MDLNSIPIFRMISKRLTWLNQRQRVLAENIANADTPRYVPNDLVPLDFAKLIRSSESKVKLASTDERHIKPRLGRRDFREREEKKPYEIAPAGNAVVLEEQMMKVAETQLDYQLTINLYRKNIHLLKMAIGRNGR